MALLEVENLKTYFDVDGKKYTAVDDISFVINEGETIAVIGESGSGKSVTALSLMGLIDYPGKIAEGKIIYNSKDLLKLKEKEMRHIRGNEIAMIYQDPMTTLNPMNKVGEQIGEALLIHKKVEKKAVKPLVIELMKSVGIMDAEERYSHLPDQFSGGMRQRLMIAMAIACNPKILIADEPTTALDVTIQAEVLDLLRSLKEKYNMAIIINTHDLGVVAEIADKVIVMYCGKIMEMTSNTELFNNPLNPYTKKLMECIPRVDDKKRRLQTIDGYVPYLTQLPKGCRFSNRCEYATEKCKTEIPDLIEVDTDHWSRCWFDRNKR